MRPLALLSITLLLPLLTAAQDTFTLRRDIAYRNGGGPYADNRCMMDIYAPEKPPAKALPVVVWFHGGGLTEGNKAVPPQLKGKGIIVVSANYRLLSGAAAGDAQPFGGSTIDETIDDAACAVAWVFRNIAALGGDTTRIVLSGHSAGGYLASMVGLDKSWLASSGIDADRIAALVPFSGQAVTHFAHRRQLGMGALQPAVDRYAPLFHVRGQAPPYIIITGDRNLELLGRYEENAYLWRMMQLAGHPACRIYEIGGFSHGAMAGPGFHILLDELRALDVID